MTTTAVSQTPDRRVGEQRGEDTLRVLEAEKRDKLITCPTETANLISVKFSFYKDSMNEGNANPSSE